MKIKEERDIKQYLKNILELHNKLVEIEERILE